MAIIFGKAPGKIILFGEHAVVYGQPAIAIPVTKVNATARVIPNLETKSGNVQLQAPDIHLDKFPLRPGRRSSTWECCTTYYRFYCSQAYPSLYSPCHVHNPNIRWNGFRCSRLRCHHSCPVCFFGKAPLNRRDLKSCL